MQSMRKFQPILALKATSRRFLSSKQSVEAGNSSSAKKNWVGILFFSSICAGTACLGVWQSQRYEWKVNLIETLKKRSGEPPVDFTTQSTNDLVTNVEEYKCRRIRIEGVFDHENEIVLGLRSAPAGMFGPAAQGMGTNPQGNYIITPLVLHDGNVIFVNRGWVPRATTTWKRPTGKVVLTTLVSDTEPGSSFAPPNDTNKRKFIWLEKTALQKSLQANGVLSGEAVEQVQRAKALVIVDEIGSEINTTSTAPFAKPPDIINSHYAQPITHLTYAVTWFSLTAIGSYMTYVKFRK